MTGLNPPRHGVQLNGARGLSPDVATLAEVMQDAGYETAAFVAAFVLDRRFGLAQGFQDYDDRVPRGAAASERLEAERPAPVVIDAAINWLRGRVTRAEAPYFLWVHLYDAHAPYEPPPAIKERVGGHPYRGEVAHVDAELGRLLQSVRSLNRSAPLIVVVGDHGESLGEHGEPGHGMLLYEPAVRVPLVIAGAGVSAAVRDDPASLVDIAPTILAKVGLTPLPDVDGRDLFGDTPAGELATYAETEYPAHAGWAPLAMLTGTQWKLIDSAEAELFDLEADPAEAKNLVATHSTVVSRARARLSQIRSRSAATSPVPLSEDAQRQLRALGYISGAAPSLPAGRVAPNPATMMREWAAFESALSASATDGARATLRSLAEAHPDSPLFVTSWARALAAAGRHGEALRVYRDASVRWPGDASLAHDRAVSARAAGLVDEAFASERAALAIDPSNALAHNGLGLLYVDVGRHAEARQSFTQATILDPTNAAYQVHLGHAARELGDLQAAEASYLRALAIDPRTPDALNGLGVVLVQTRRADQAVSRLEEAVALEPAFVEAQLNLGIARQEIGDRAGARAAYERVLQAPSRFANEQKAARALLAGLR
jgi:tetratricopeptide (TPR) repeat protein